MIQMDNLAKRDGPLRLKTIVPDKIKLRGQRNQQVIESLKLQILERPKLKHYLKVRPKILKRLNKRSEERITKCQHGWRDVNKWLRRLGEPTVEWVSDGVNNYFTKVINNL